MIRWPVRLRRPSRSHLALMAIVALAWPESARSEDVLHFRNGDRLRGNLRSIDAKADRLTWATPAAPEPLAFHLGPVTRVDAAAAGRSPRDSHTRLQLTNGDMWSGRLLSLDGEQAVLETWAAGTVRMPAAMIASLSPQTSASQPYLDGPGEKRDWRFSSPRNTGRWEIRDQRMEIVGQSFVGRNIRNLRRQGLRLAFTLEWSHHPNLLVYVYADARDSAPRNAYSLQISGTNLFLNRMRDGRNHRMAQYPMGLPAGTNQAEFEVFVHPEEAAFLVRVNGREGIRARDPDGFRGQGDGLVFMVSQAFPHVVADLQAEPWTDPLPEGAEPTGPTDQDTVVFNNGDRLAGTVTGIADGVATINTPFADLDVPMERISAIQFASESRASPRRARSAVQILLADRGRITLDLDSVGPDGVTGTAAAAGAVTIRRDALVRLDLPAGS